MSTIQNYEETAAALDKQASGAMSQNQVVLVCGKDVKIEPVQWIWKGWIPREKLITLSGDPGDGKTTLALEFAATITVGGRWPDGTKSEVANILIWSGEDGVADTLLPRLLAAGANKDRCYFVGGTRTDGGLRSFDPARDLADLELQAQLIGGVSLIIVDPIVSAITGDSHKNSEVRRDLQPLVDLAERLNASVLGISHFSKGGVSLNPAMRVIGSVAFTAVSRIVLVVAKVKDDESGQHRRVLARAKSNLGPDDGGFEYFIEQTEIGAGIIASRITWGQYLEGTAKELFAEPEDESAEGDESKTAIGQAMDFLQQALLDGITPSKEVTKQAREAGITSRTLRRARERLGVIPKKGAGGIWYWKLKNIGFQELTSTPAQDNLTMRTQQRDHGVQPQINGQVGHLGKDAAEIQLLLPASDQVVQLVHGFETGQLDGQVTLDPDDCETI